MGKETISLSVGSETAAERAREYLRGAGIAAKIIKIEARVKDGGCLFGLLLDTKSAGDAMRILTSKGIRTRVL